MRVLICSTTYPPKWNGQSIFTNTLAEGLAALGHNVTVLIPGKPTESKNEIINGVKIIRISSLQLGLIHPDFQITYGYKEIIQRIFDENQPAIIHVQDASLHSQAVIQEANKRNIPTIATHHMGPEIGAPYFSSKTPIIGCGLKWFTWHLINKHLDLVNRVLVPSQFSSNMLRDNGCKNPATIIPCGLRLHNRSTSTHSQRELVFENFGLDTNCITLFYAGRLDVEKKVNLLIRSMAFVEIDNIQLVIAGSGPLSENLHQLAENIGVGKRVFFLGELAHDEILSLLLHVDIFVTPGNAESFSISTVEAMSCGLPILAANAAALPELINHGEGGYLFIPDDTQDLVKGIHYLLDRKEQWASIAEINIKRAQKYDLTPIVERYEQFYISTIQSSQKRTQQLVQIKGLGKPYWPPISRWSLKSNLLFPSLLLLILMVFSLGISYDNAQAAPDIKLGNIAPLNLMEIQRVMIIAPHPDDESLGSAGLLQAVLDQGGDVQVVIVTNGDGQIVGPVLTSTKLFPNSENYIQYGRERQQETLTALSTLGISQDMVKFLGYPDGSLQNIWNSHWAENTLISGKYTNVSANPYEIRYKDDAVYKGLAVIQDLTNLLDDFQPDLVLLPHPEDTNKDHQTVSNFSRFAIANYESKNENQIRILGYLVHYQGYPIPRKYERTMSLLPPLALSNDGLGWTSYLLKDKEISQKYAAIKSYGTQQKIMSSYLDSFVRANEIYYELPSTHLPFIAYEEVASIQQEFKFSSKSPLPVLERFSKLAISGSDLVSWQTARLGDKVCFGAETRGTLQKWIDYRILLKLPDGKTVQEKGNSNSPFLSDRNFWTCFSLEELGNPDVIGFSAETWNGVLLDTTSWQFIIVNTDF